ncbi:hypothetical protein ACJ41O_008912 [Fusarium nematophilum]
MERLGRLYSEAGASKETNSATNLEEHTRLTGSFYVGNPEGEQEDFVDALDIIEASQELGISSVIISHMGIDDESAPQSKPENIIVLFHKDPSREIVARLVDFGGSTLRSDGSYAKPLHFTPLRCAPEVQEADMGMDWQKCHVYSYGLVVASLWG